MSVSVLFIQSFRGRIVERHSFILRVKNNRVGSLPLSALLLIAPDGENRRSKRHHNNSNKDGGWRSAIGIAGPAFKDNVSSVRVLPERNLIVLKIEAKIKVPPEHRAEAVLVLDAALKGYEAVVRVLELVHVRHRLHDNLDPVQVKLQFAEGRGEITARLATLHDVALPGLLVVRLDR